MIRARAGRHPHEIDDNALSLLSEAAALARSNFVRALLNGVAALLVMWLTSFVDGTFIAGHSAFRLLSEEGINALWAAKWIAELASSLYMLWAFGHVFISWKHLLEARFLSRRVDRA